MARKVFYSFHFNEDHWRASTVRQIGSLESNDELSDNDWEAVKKKGDSAIKSWIEGQFQGRSCAVVLVGSGTAGRPWITYEIRRAWELKKGVVGVRINKLLNSKQLSSYAGSNPFSSVTIGTTTMSSIVTLYDPPGGDSKAAYKSISENIGNLVESAITLRSRYS